MNIEEIKKESKDAETYLKSVSEDYYFDGTLGSHLDTALYNVGFLLQEIEKLQQENERLTSELSKPLGNWYMIVGKGLTFSEHGLKPYMKSLGWSDDTINQAIEGLHKSGRIMYNNIRIMRSN